MEFKLGLVKEEGAKLRDTKREYNYKRKRRSSSHARRKGKTSGESPSDYNSGTIVIANLYINKLIILSFLYNFTYLINTFYS